MREIGGRTWNVCVALLCAAVAVWELGVTTTFVFIAPDAAPRNATLCPMLNSTLLPDKCRPASLRGIFGPDAREVIGGVTLDSIYAANVILPGAVFALTAALAATPGRVERPNLHSVMVAVTGLLSLWAMIGAGRASYLGTWWFNAFKEWARAGGVYHSVYNLKNASVQSSFGIFMLQMATPSPLGYKKVAMFFLIAPLNLMLMVGFIIWAYKHGAVCTGLAAAITATAITVCVAAFAAELLPDEYDAKLKRWIERQMENDGPNIENVALNSRASASSAPGGGMTRLPLDASKVRP